MTESRHVITDHPIGVAGRHAGLVALVIIAAAAVSLGEDQAGSTGDLKDRAIREASKVIQAAFGATSFGDLVVDHVEQERSELFSCDSILVAFRPELNVRFELPGLKLLEIWRTLSAPRVPSDDRRAWSPEDAIRRAQEYVRGINAAYLHDVGEVHARPQRQHGDPPTLWRVAWCRIHNGLRVDDSMSVEVDERMGLLAFCRNFRTTIESEDAKLAEADALSAAREASAATVAKFSEPRFSRWLRHFKLGDQLSPEQLGDLAPLLGLWIIRPEYPLRDSFRSPDDFARTHEPIGRLAYCFAFRLHGPRFNDGTGIADKQLLIWIDATNAEVLKVAF